MYGARIHSLDKTLLLTAKEDLVFQMSCLSYPL